MKISRGMIDIESLCTLCAFVPLCELMLIPVPLCELMLIPVPLCELMLIPVPLCEIIFKMTYN